MKTIYRISKMGSADERTQSARWINDFTEKEKDKYLANNNGTFYIQTIVVVRNNKKTKSILR